MLHPTKLQLETLWQDFTLAMGRSRWWWWGGGHESDVRSHPLGWVGNLRHLSVKFGY